VDASFRELITRTQELVHFANRVCESYNKAPEARKKTMLEFLQKSATRADELLYMLREIEKSDNEW
jgi:hypothetical protein